MDLKELKRFLEEHDDYIILTHKSPDGDTLGSAFALCEALRNMGKQANVINNENFPVRYNFLYDGYYAQSFETQTVVAVDIADEKLFGSRLGKYVGNVDLCIDQRISNTGYAKNTVVDGAASAASLVLFEFFRQENIPLTDQMAKCLYTGIATDTGCFKFENTTPRAHFAAAELMTYNIEFSKINRKMFDIKSRKRLETELLVSEKMEYYFNDRCAVISLTSDIMEKSGVEPAEFDGLASIPLCVEGVDIGITIKQRHENVFKLSVRTTEKIDASAFCRAFGGGGHIRAAGCEITGELEDVKKAVLEEAEKHL